MINIESLAINPSGEFWYETTKRALIHGIERYYNGEVLRTHGIKDVIISGDKYLLQWYKRVWPLTDSEIIEKYGQEYLSDKQDKDEDKTSDHNQD